MGEIWKNIDIDEKLYDSYVVTEIIQNLNGTTITLSGDTNEMLIFFNIADSIRVTDKGGRLKTYYEVPEI